MKKFIFKVILFFILVTITDLTFGKFFSYLRVKAKGGITANCEYIANRCKDDIIILGSSRAKHHYVPTILQDTLGMSCYNCGEEGNGIVLAYGRFKQITERYTPRLIIYEVTPEYDYLLHDPDSRYLSLLRPYYFQPSVSAIVKDFGGEFEEIKMGSSMYRYNSKLLTYILDFVKKTSRTNGYSPLLGQLEQSDYQEDLSADYGDQFDEHKFSYIEKMIKETKYSDIPFCMVVSPIFCRAESVRNYEPIHQLCEMYNVPFIDLRIVSLISEVPVLFQDIEHLNDNGAKAYSKIFASKIKELLGTVN